MLSMIRYVIDVFASFHLYFDLCCRMEFGLQKPERMGSPILVGNPRKRIEAKAYRARDRMDNGWFRHDTGTPENSPNVSPAASPLRGRSQAVLGNLPLICAHCACTKQQQLHKFQQHVVAAGVRSDALKRAQSPNKIHSSDATARLQQQIFGSCSDWYRHQHTVISNDVDEEQKNEKDECRSPVPMWWPRDGTGSSQFSPHSRRVCAEAEEYWKRNHDGSAKDWYRHEHTVMEEKENELADVNEIGTSPAKESGSNEANPNFATNGHGCCICGGLNMSPAKETNKRACQQVLTERF